MTKTTKEERNEIRLLEARATMGPWLPSESARVPKVLDRDGGLVCEFDTVNGTNDREAVAAMRNIFPDLLADLDAAEAERDAHADEARELRSVLLRHNFAPCDTAACNCNGWHERSTGNGFYARFREIEEAVGEHDGQTLLDAVKQIVAERKAAVLWAEKAEKAMTCKGCGGTVGDHLAPDQGGCPGSFEIDGVQMVPLAGRNDAIAQRDRAESERDSERKLRVEAEAAATRAEAESATFSRRLAEALVRNDEDDLGCDRARMEEMRDERDAIKAKLAALETEAMEVGYLTGTVGHCGDRDVLTVRMSPESARKWNKHVAAIAAARGGAS